MQGFDVVCKVGEGAFAQVYKVKRKADGMLYAMKRILLKGAEARDVSNCLNEVRILASIHHPYVLSYREAFYEEHTGHLCLVTEYADGGDLTALLAAKKKRKETVSEELIWKMALQMLHGLRHLHKAGVFHRDIKCANVLLSKGVAKIADMNVSKISKGGLANTMAGTPYYTSPEVWLDYPYNQKCDIWSLGCVLYELAAQRPPFLAKDISSLRTKIIDGRYQALPSTYSRDLDDLIRSCLTVHSKLRPSANTLLTMPVLRKRLYLFPDELFQNSAVECKENNMLETIKAPSRARFGDLKQKLPKSNYHSENRTTNSMDQLNKKIPEKLPLIKKQELKQDFKQNYLQPLIPMRQKLIYLR